MNGENTKTSNPTPSRSSLRRRAALAFCAMVAALAVNAASAALTPVYRFYHLDAGRHFYTASESEKSKVLTTYPRFAYEGVAFYAYATQDAGTIPVYRFYHQLNGSHVYTASETEKASIIANFPVYAYEGIAYYAEGNGNTGAIALLRLYNTKLGTHFFTTNQSEANNAVAQWPWFAYEGTVYFVRGAAAPGANVPPIVSLAVSHTTAAVGTFVTLTATASDPDGSVVKVEYLRDGVKFGETTKAPHQFGYSLGAAGIHNFTAVAIDDGGMTAVSGVASVNATGGGGGGGGGGGPSGNLSPTVTLTSTSTSIAAGGNAMLSATPFDPDGTIAKVEFYDDTTLLATVSSAPYSYTFTSSVVGNHTLGAKVYDNLGATGTSNALIVVVAGGGGGGGGGTNQAPTVTLSSGANAIAAGGTTTLTATATDPDGTISRVEFYDGTTLIGNDTSSPFTFNFSSSVVGSHGLRAIAYDNLNLSTTSATVNVQVNAVAGSSLPRVTLAASTTLVPPNGTVTLTATATAQATGATIATVSFYMDGVKLADDTVTPYTFSATIPAGTHTIYATATDSQGNIKATLTQTVTAGTAPPVATTSADVWRLLNQATFGASQAEAARVAQLGGIAQWIDDQFTKPISGYPDAKYNRIQLATTADCNTQMPGGGNFPGDSPEAMCARDHLTLAMVQRDFWTNAVYAPDQLRQRVAWALSQIIVTSANEQDLSYAHVMSRYQNLMFQEAFGNYRVAAREGVAEPGDGQLPRRGEQRPSGWRARPERELRSRNHAAVLDRTRRAQCRRHAAARCARPHDPDLRPGRDRRVRAHLHRLHVLERRQPGGPGDGEARPLLRCADGGVPDDGHHGSRPEPEDAAERHGHAGQSNGRPGLRLGRAERVHASQHGAVRQQAAHPAPGHGQSLAGLRRAHQRGVRQQRLGRARRPPGGGARDPARSGSARPRQDGAGLRNAEGAGAGGDGSSSRALRRDRRRATFDANRQPRPEPVLRADGVQLLPAGFDSPGYVRPRARVRDPHDEHRRGPREPRVPVGVPAFRG